MFFRYLLFSIYFCSFSSDLVGQTCENPVGTWKNELGSVLVIDTVLSSGQLLGSYRSSTGVDGMVFNLTGLRNRLFSYPDEWNYSFSVKWDGFGSITSWTGYCDNNHLPQQIETMWHLVRSGKEYPWERIITNSSVFHPFTSD